MTLSVRQPRKHKILRRSMTGALPQDRFEARILAFVVMLLTALGLVSCADSDLFDSGRKDKTAQGSTEEGAEDTEGSGGGGPVTFRKKTQANFGGVPPPSTPSLETRVALSIALTEDEDNPLPPEATLGLAGGLSVSASYAVVGCASGYNPSGNFTNSGTRVLYRSDRGCAISLSTLTVNGINYTLRDGTFATAQGSSNAFVSVATSTIIAVQVKTQLNAQLGAAGEIAEFTAHLVSPGPNQNLNGFLIVTPVPASSTVTENSGSATYNLQVQGSSSQTTTVHYTLSGIAQPTYDYSAVSGTIDIPPGATLVPLTISLLNDSTPEVDETLILTLDKTKPNYFPVESSPTITITDDDIVYPTTGLAARYEPSGHVVTAGALSSWNDSSGNALHAIQGTAGSRPTQIVAALNGFNAASFDGVNDFVTPPNSALLSEASFTAKTFSFALRTGTNVTTRQVIYRQGDTTRGMAVYLQNGFLYFAGYNGNNDDSGATTPWGVRHVRAEVLADTVYIVRCVYDRAANQLQLYLDTELAATASDVGTLFFTAGAGSNLGGIASTASIRFHDGATTTGASYFQGLIYEFAHYNNNTTGTAGLNLDIFLFKRYGMGLPQKVSVTAAATGIAEQSGSTTLTISRSQVGASSLAVPLNITGSATAGNDYVALAASVTIPAYQSSTTLTVTAIDDALSDSGETVSVGIGASSSYVFGPSKLVTVEIADNESFNPPSSQFIYYRGSNVTYDGSNRVTAWNNTIAGGLHNGTPGSQNSRKPTYIASSGLNSRPALSFDGGDEMTIASHAAINSGGPYNFRSIALVFRTGADVTSSQILYKQGNAANSGFSIAINGSNLHFEAWNTAGQIFGPRRISRAVTANTNYFVIFQFNGATGQLSGRMNGVDYSSTGTIGSLPSDSGPQNGNSMGFVSGRTNINGSSASVANFTGLIAEFLYFNAALSWAQIREMENYFLPYYGL